MPITLPNLDDRRYADLVEEARDLLVANAPSLTNHNPSDPVVTIAELFAYFTEVLLFRVNAVTDANRVKFLRLLNGPDWPVPLSRAELDAEVRRTVLELRRTDRAVTAADVEFLATAADPAGRIARAHCIPERNLELTDPTQRGARQPGHVSVVIVPFQPADLAVLQTVVADYLEPRRLLTARVHVVGPRSVPVRVQVTLRLMPDALEATVRPRAVAALQSFLDPIVGRDGSGWPLGRNVYVSEIYRLLDTLAGVDFVRRTIDPATTSSRDELVTTPALANRVVRNAAGDLISIALDPDELVDYQSAGAAVDLVFEQPPPTV
jgi:baseplate J-like protein